MIDDHEETLGLLSGGDGGGDIGLELRQLRQRGSSSFSNPASRDSDDDSVDLPRPRRASGIALSLIPQQPSNFPSCCFFFSAAGAIFLSIIAAQLASNSIYLRVSRENSSNKAELAEGVRGAAYMYAACALISLWFMWRQRRNVLPTLTIESHRAVD